MRILPAVAYQAAQQAHVILRFFALCATRYTFVVDEARTTNHIYIYTYAGMYICLYSRATYQDKRTYNDLCRGVFIWSQPVALIVALASRNILLSSSNACNASSAPSVSVDTLRPTLPRTGWSSRGVDVGPQSRLASRGIS